MHGSSVRQLGCTSVCLIGSKSTVCRTTKCRHPKNHALTFSNKSKMSKGFHTISALENREKELHCKFLHHKENLCFSQLWSTKEILVEKFWREKNASSI